MGEFGDYFKSWNWELGFRYSRNEEELVHGGSVSSSGLREALLDTNPATAFNPFLGFFGRNSKAAISRVYVTLHRTGEFELPLGYFTINGDLFNLPAGPVSFAVGGEYRGERWKSDPDSQSTTFDADRHPQYRSSTGEPGRLGNLSGSAISGNKPAVELPRCLQPRVRYCRARGMVQPKHLCGSAHQSLPFVPAGHSTYDAQKPKFSVRWQPLDPKWIGALTLRGSYSEAFHAPTLPDLTPAGSERHCAEVHDPRGLTPPGTIVAIIHRWKPQPEAGGCLRMDLWSGLQSEMDQGSYIEC